MISGCKGLVLGGCGVCVFGLGVGMSIWAKKKGGIGLAPGLGRQTVEPSRDWSKVGTGLTNENGKRRNSRVM
jgi:hypothetical protein